jgi:FkbM family methyltransferase
MIKNFSQIIYFFLKIINLIFEKVLNRNILLWIKYFIEEDAYKKIKLKSGKYLNFFSPNFLIELQIKDFYKKEPETLQWIDNFKKEKKIIFWDIGANIGLYSIYAATSNENIEVISFEPSTSNLRVLSRNISINNLENKIKIFQIPLGLNKNFFLEFNEEKFIEGECNNSIDKNINFEGKEMRPVNKYQIFSTNIEQIIEDKILEIPDYIKIDVDGIEHLILAGGINFFKNQKILEIQIEINENYADQHENVLKIMNECSFKLKEKKRNDLNGYYSNEKLSGIYNYYFTR